MENARELVAVENTRELGAGENARELGAGENAIFYIFCFPDFPLQSASKLIVTPSIHLQ